MTILRGISLANYMRALWGNAWYVSYETKCKILDGQVTLEKMILPDYIPEHYQMQMQRIGILTALNIIKQESKESHSLRQWHRALEANLNACRVNKSIKAK